VRSTRAVSSPGVMVSSPAAMAKGIMGASAVIVLNSVWQRGGRLQSRRWPAVDWSNVNRRLKTATEPIRLRIRSIKKRGLSFDCSVVGARIIAPPGEGSMPS